MTAPGLEEGRCLGSLAKMNQRDRPVTLEEKKKKVSRRLERCDLCKVNFRTNERCFPGMGRGWGSSFTEAVCNRVRKN